MDPDDYCPLDANLLRTDHAERPELNKGTVDFIVSEDYWAPHPPPTLNPLYQPVIPEPVAGRRKPEPLNYVFAIDVSMDAYRSGFARAACQSLLHILYGGPSETGNTLEPCFPPHSRLCIITFDRTLHFYNLAVRMLFPHLCLVLNNEAVLCASQV